jgi:excisionase family DNA binding protein
MSTEVLLTRREAASLGKVSEDTLDRWVKQGLIRKFKTPGGHNRYLETDVLGLIQLQKEVAH